MSVKSDFVPTPNLNFDNTFRNNLPSDPIEETYPRQVEHVAYSEAMPTQVKQPKTIIVADEVAELFNFEQDFIESDYFAQVFTGNQLIEGMKPYAMCYGGFQFGHWAGQLGDGRAINLGEVNTAKHGYQTLQLKGSGPTPYSRTADGFAVLRSSVREFLCSEAMYHLGIPTTRALSLCLTGEHVVRDIMYNGNAKPELGAIVCRVSPSFMRFGTIQLPATRRDLELLTQLVNYSINHDFPELLEAKISTDTGINTNTDTNKSAEQNVNSKIDKAVYLAWFSKICETTCDLIVHWMRVGFVHGVMNTDNLSLIGETIDFGPYGWIDNFDLDWTPNTTDNQNKRYRFGAQAEISLWNLCQLANSIIPLVGSTEELQTIVEGYNALYQQKWLDMMLQKLGLAKNSALTNIDTPQIKQTDITLCRGVENLLGEIETDMTIFYRLLAKFSLNNTEINSIHLKEHFAPCFYNLEQVNDEYLEKFISWMQQYKDKFIAENGDDKSRALKMNKVNPKFVLRNYLSQQAIDKAEMGDFSEIHRLHAILKKPYNEQPEFEEYATKRPDWAKNKVGCSMLSCSS